MKKTKPIYKTVQTAISRAVCLMLLLALLPMPAFAAPVSRSAENQTVFRFETNRALQGSYGTTWLYFQIPHYWEVSELSAHIEIQLSPLVLDVLADLTFYLNDDPVYSMKIDYQNGETQIIDIPLDRSKLITGFNSFYISGAARIYDEDGCIDDTTAANWTIIKGDSYLSISYLMNETTDISEYPYPFLSTLDEDGSQLTVMVPGQPSDGELTAAAWIRANLANETGGKDLIQLAASSSIPAQGNAIYIGLYQELAEDIKAMLPPEAHAEGLTEHNAILCGTKTETGGNILIMTALKDETLIKAAQSIIHQEFALQEMGSCAAIDVRNTRYEDVSPQEDFTVSDLSGTKDPLRFDGVFRQEQTLYIPEGGYILGASGSADISFRYSKNLDFSKSMLTVLINQTPVASRKLTEENADNDHLRFSIPEDMAGKELSSISIVFDLELPDTYCTAQITDRPWAILDASSGFHLPISTDTLYSFDILPYPFQGGGAFNNTVYVVPDDLTPENLSLLSQMISLYSSCAACKGSMKVVRESNLTEADKINSNLIFTGILSSFYQIEELREVLSFPFDEERTRFLGNEEFVLSDSYAGSVSVMELLPSPYSQGKTVLFAVSASEECAGRLAAFLSDKANRDKLTGDTVIVDRNGDIRAFEFHTVNQTVERPSLRERIEAHKESVVFALVSTSSVLLILLASIIILIRARKPKKAEKSKKRYVAKH